MNWLRAQLRPVKASKICEATHGATSAARDSQRHLTTAFSTFARSNVRGLIPDIEAILRSRFVDHRQGGLHATFSETPELAGNTPIGMRASRLVKYQRVCQQPLNGHLSIEHKASLKRIESQPLGCTRHSPWLQRQSDVYVLILSSISFLALPRFWLFGANELS
jgi:hypothetical protein